MEIEFDDEVRALILLSSLPDSWNATVTAVIISSGNSRLKFDDVRDLVLSEEIRPRESGETSNSSVLHTESRGRTSERNSNLDEANLDGERKISTVIIVERKVISRMIVEHRRKIPAHRNPPT